jgi:hypothetical protein
MNYIQLDRHNLVFEKKREKNTGMSDWSSRSLIFFTGNNKKKKISKEITKHFRSHINIRLLC